MDTKDFTNRFRNGMSQILHEELDARKTAVCITVPKTIKWEDYMAEINDASKALEANLDVYGTIGDIADYFGKSKDAVNGIIKRNVAEKPKRNIVLYRFKAFLKRAPTNWRTKH